jgi:hypothetical protein
MKCHLGLLLMINEVAFIKSPLLFKNKFFIYPPSVKEIIETKEFPMYRRLFTLSQEELEDEFIKNNKDKIIDNIVIPTPFEYLLKNIEVSPQFSAIAKKAFKYFLHEDVSFLLKEGMILIGNVEKEILRAKSVEDLKFLKEEDYFEFQNLIRESLGEKSIEPPNPNEDPRVKRIKAKARYRDSIKMKKGLGISLGTSLASICCMGLGITPLNIGEMSYASLGSITRTYQEKEKYQIDIDSLLAGADSKKIKPKYWIRNLED